MVFYKEYLAEVGGRQKRVGIIGEEHELYNRRESAFVAGLLDRFSLVGFEGVGGEEFRKMPKYEQVNQTTDFYAWGYWGRLGSGRNKDSFKLAIGKGKPHVFLESAQSMYPNLHSMRYMMRSIVGSIGNIILTPASAPLSFIYGLYRRKAPAVEMPAKPYDIDDSPEIVQRSFDMVASAASQLKKEEVNDILLDVGKHHFVDLALELDKVVPLTRIEPGNV